MVLDKLVCMFGLDRMGWIVTTWYNLHTGRLFGCNCLLKKSCEMVRTCIHSHILTAWIFFQPSCKPVVLNKYVLMFGLHHMGCIVTVWIAVGCFVVSACLKYSSEMVWTSIITRIPPAWLSSHLLQTNGIGQTSVYVWVGPHGLHCRNLIQFAYWQVVWL